MTNSSWWTSWTPTPGFNPDGPDDVIRRPCGCRIDPVVFGHCCVIPVDAP